MRFRDLHRNLQIRICEKFMSSLLGNMLLPFMTIYLAERFGATVAGGLLVLNSILAVFVGFYSGHLADRLGRRRILILAEAGRVVAFLVMTLSNSSLFDSSVLTYLTMTVASVCFGLSQPAAQAMVIDVSTPENRKYVYSLDYWSNNAGLILGGVLGGLLFQAHRFGLMVALTIGSVISLTLLLFWVTETYLPKPHENQAPKKSVMRAMLDNYKLVLKDSTFMIFVVAATLVISIEQQIRNYAAVRLSNEMHPQNLIGWNQFHFMVNGVNMFGFVSAENAILVIAVGAFIGKMIKKFRDKTVLVLGLLMFAAGFAWIGYSNIAWLLIIAMLIGTLGELIFFPVMQSFLAELIPADSRSSYLAMYALVQRVSLMLGSASVALGEVFPSWAMALLVFACGLIGMLLFQVIIGRLQARKLAIHAQEAVQS